MNKKYTYISGIDEAGRAVRKASEPPAISEVRSGERRPVPYLIGIDEAGRGPLAGPIVVAGVLVPRRIARGLFKGIRDSKKLSAKQREEWFFRLTNVPELAWATAAVWPKVIDRINIARAADRGAWRVCQKFHLSLSAISPHSLSSGSSPFKNMQVRSDRFLLACLSHHEILLDGGLKLPTRIPHRAIIKGDEKIPVIAAASIIAKVTRDRIMVRLHKKHPLYRFDLHKGYGTELHRGVIAAVGISPLHRKTFCTRFFTLRSSDESDSIMTW